MDAQDLPVHLSSFWSLQFSPNIYISNETSYYLPQISRNTDGCLFGRYANSSSDQRGTPQMEINGPGFIRKPGFPHQLQEVRIGTHLIFLGFLINTMNMQIRLPKDKISQAVQEAQKLLEAQQDAAKQLAHLIGVFSSTLPAILPAPLHYRGLQLLRHQALKKGGYDMILPLSQEAKDDLLWWIQNLSLVNGQPLVRDQPSLLIETDASLMGWGAVCQE